MTKTQTWNAVQELMANHTKLPKAFKEELELILAPKSGGGSQNPSYEENGVTYHYCRFHKVYEPEENMVMSQDKSKGYCKASISLWNKTNASIKKLDSEAVNAMADDNFEEAKALATEAKELKAGLNNPENYDLERDWEVFNTPKTTKESTEEA